MDSPVQQEVQMPWLDDNEADAFKTLVTSYQQYQQVKEEEHTKRVKIEAELTTNLEKMRHQRDMFELMLTKTFEGREKTIDRFFERLDRALDENKNDVAIQALSSIEGIVKTSPLEGLFDTKQALANPNSTFEF